MTTTTKKATFRIRRDLAANWDSINPILKDGQLGYATDAGVLKVGNGSLRWSQITGIAANNGAAIVQVGAIAPSATMAPNATAVQTAIASAANALLNGAGPAFDTLNELAAALGNDANFATTMASALAGKQPLDADLTAIAALVSAVDKSVYATGPGTWALYSLTAFARSLAACADAAAVRGLLGLTAGAPATTTFNQLIPLDAYRTMGITEVSAIGTNLAFNVDSNTEVDYGECNLSLVADGVHNVTIDASIEQVGDQTYDNTDGRLQAIRFWRESGRRFYANALGPILAPPAVVSAVIDPNDATRVNLTWSQAIDADVSPASAFAIAGKTISAHNVDDSLHSHLTVTAGFVGGTAATAGYTAPATHKMRRHAAQFTRENTADFSGVAIVDQDLDPFTYADAFVPLATPTGKAYSAFGGGAFAISGNRLAITTTGSFVFDSLRKDGLFEALMAQTAAGVDGTPALLFRCVDSTNMWLVTWDATTVYLAKRIAGVDTYFTTPLAHAAGVDYYYSVVCNGNTIQVYRNGALITGLGTAGTVTDAQFATATKVGVSGFSGKGISFDNLRAAPLGTPPSTGQLILLADTFNRADGNVGTSSHGETWSDDFEGSTPGPMVISTNQLRASDPSGAMGMVTLNAGQTDYTVSVDIASLGNDFPSLVFRGNGFWGNGGSGAHVRATISGGTVYLIKNVGGADTTLGSAADPGGTSFSVSVSPANLIVVKRGGTTVLSITDATHATQTRVGFRTGYNASATRTLFDNFLVTRP